MITNLNGKDYEIEFGDSGMKLRKAGISEWNNQELAYSDLAMLLALKEKAYLDNGRDVWKASIAWKKEIVRQLTAQAKKRKSA